MIYFDDGRILGLGAICSGKGRTTFFNTSNDVIGVIIDGDFETIKITRHNTHTEIAVANLNSKVSDCYAILKNEES